MNLLVVTQKVDRDDPILGFFHQWLEEFARQYSSTTVICLEKGRNELPRSVQVLSLGKDSKRDVRFKILSRAWYLVRFYRYIFSHRKRYDAVFVHMNQEYVILGFPVWKFFRKKVMLWRNHSVGNIFTDLAMIFADRVFCTSRFSYTARNKKTLIMPVGIDASLFRKDVSDGDIQNSVLYVGRISRIKSIDLLIEALSGPRFWGGSATCDIIGSPYSPDDHRYFAQLKDSIRRYGLGEKVRFLGSVPNTEVVHQYATHTVTVNLSPDGMFDKVIFEAMSCESLVLTSNRNLFGKIDNMFLFKQGDASDLAKKLSQLVVLKSEERVRWGQSLRAYVVANHSIEKLVSELLAHS